MPFKSRYFYQMDSDEIRQTIQSGLTRSGLSQHKAALAAGLPADAIRSIIEGHEPRASRLAAVCRALGLEFYIGPPRDRPPLPRVVEIERAPQPSTSQAAADMTTVSDPKLAEMIAVLADAWEAADTLEQGHMLGRFDLAFQRERERAASRPGPRLAGLARD